MRPRSSAFVKWERLGEREKALIVSTRGLKRATKRHPPRRRKRIGDMVVSDGFLGQTAKSAGMGKGRTGRVKKEVQHKKVRALGRRAWDTPTVRDASRKKPKQSLKKDGLQSWRVALFPGRVWQPEKITVR